MLSKIYPYLLGMAIGIIVLVCFSPFKKCNGKGVITTEQKGTSKEEIAIKVIANKEGTTKDVQDVLKEKGAIVSKKSKSLPDVKKVAEKVRLKVPDYKEPEKFDSTIVDSLINLAILNNVLLVEANSINVELSSTIDSLRLTEQEKQALYDALVAQLRVSKDSLKTELDKKKGLGWKRFKQGFAVGGLLGLAGGVFIAKP